MRRSMWVVVSGAVFLLATYEAAQWIDGRAGSQWGSTSEGNPFAHAAAMTAVYALAVTTAALLLRAGWWGAAALTVTGAALGPLSLLSPPWSAHVSDVGVASAPTAARLAVGLLVATWMLAVAWFAQGGGGAPRSSYELASYGLPLTVVLTGYFTVPGALTDPGHADISLGALFGWALLTAGVVAAGLATARIDGSRAVTVSVSVLPVLALGVVAGMYAAYNSTGGWPTIAGWALAQPPIYATVATAAFLVLGGGVAALAGPVVRLAKRRTPDADVEVAAPQPIGV